MYLLPSFFRSFTHSFFNTVSLLPLICTWVTGQFYDKRISRDQGVSE